MSVEIQHLTKSYGTVPVIPDLSLTFHENAISVLLGASGCGKTTTLRCIAGLEEPNGGIIRIAGRLVFSAQEYVNVPPERRELGMVFQSYAIWPHMTVFENVAAPLRSRKINRADVARRVADTLSLVGLAGMGDRSAARLSGGQQQRVAIARCIVHQPQLIVLDEPLSNLDAKLRVGMRTELRQLQRRLNATMIFVTHDQEEAMFLADEIFLFNQGRVEQHGPPRELYGRPTTRYGAEFLGKANLFAAMVVADAAGAKIVSPTGGHAIAISTGTLAGEVTCMIRPEAWVLGDVYRPGLPGCVVDALFLGDRQELRVSTPFGTQMVTAPGHQPFCVGDNLTMTVDRALVHLLPS